MPRFTYFKQLMEEAQTRRYPSITGAGNGLENSKLLSDLSFDFKKCPTNLQESHEANRREFTLASKPHAMRAHDKLSTQTFKIRDTRV